MSDQANRLSEAELDHITDYTNGGNAPQCLMSVDLHRLLATARDYARLEAENERWQEINRDELGETLRLMEALGVMDEVRDGKPCMDAMLSKIAAITSQWDTANRQVATITAERDRLAEALRRISINTNDNGSGAADFARTALEGT